MLKSQSELYSACSDAQHHPAVVRDLLRVRFVAISGATDAGGLHKVGGKMSREDNLEILQHQSKSKASIDGKSTGCLNKNMFLSTSKWVSDWTNYSPQLQMSFSIPDDRSVQISMQNDEKDHFDAFIHAFVSVCVRF